MLESSSLFMKISCIIVNYNDANTCISLVDKIKDFKELNYIIIVDNMSTDNSFEILNEYKNTKNIDNLYILKSLKNGGYGYGNNFGVNFANKMLKCDYALISNPDVIFTEECLLELLKTMENNKDCAVVSTVQLNTMGVKTLGQCWDIPKRRDLVLGSSIIWRRLIRSFRRKIYFNEKIYKTECVAGSLLLTRITFFIDCGGYDEEVFLFEEESILGFKIKEIGYDTLYLTTQSYIHAHSVSISKSIPKEIKQIKLLFSSRIIFLRKYLKCSKFELFFYKIYYSILIFEYFFWKKIKKIIN